MLFDKYELRYLPLFREELKERALYIAVDLGNPKASSHGVDISKLLHYNNYWCDYIILSENCQKKLQPCHFL